MKEISKEEYNLLMEKLETAEDNLQAYHLRKGRYWVNQYHYFLSTAQAPCSYNGGGGYVPCLFTGDGIKRVKKLPKSFNTGGQWEYEIYHFSPKGCPNLTMKDYVLCLTTNGDKYYFGRHKVGKCPHKK